MLTTEQIAKTIDHALLKPDLIDSEIEAGCLLAVQHQVASVCLRPADVPRGRECLAGSSVCLSTVIGFPLGANTTRVKLQETEEAITSGCQEVDLVLNIGKLRSGDKSYVEKELDAVISLAHRLGAAVKVILENCYLTDPEKILACRICSAVGADYVKTSTGFAPGGAALADIRLMRENVAPGVKIKAAGGIRSLDHLLAFLAAGADRIGTSATGTILADARRREADGCLVLPAANKGA